MIRLSFFILCGLMITAFPSRAADKFGSVSASISRIITIAETSPLEFGTIAISPLSGIVTLDASGQSNTTIPSAQVTGSYSAAEFSVSGDPGAVVTISFSTGDTLAGPGTPLALSDFTHDAGGTPTIDLAGSLVFKVGASLAVNTNQITGSYTGQYTVTINYN